MTSSKPDRAGLTPPKAPPKTLAKTPRKLLRSLTGVLTLVVLGGCATQMFTVTSDPPQAEIYIETSKFSPKSGEKSKTPAAASDRKSVGKTPLSIPMAQLRSLMGKNIASGEYFPVTLEKPGFTAETFQIPATRYGTMITSLNVKLRVEPPKGEDSKDGKDVKDGKDGVRDAAKESKTAKDILDHIFLAQKYAVTQQFERAQIEIDKVLNDFPSFPRALSMRASIYYAQKNWVESLKWYEEALKADPQMDDAVKMSAKIRAIQSGRAPTNPNDAETNKRSESQ